VANSNLLSIKKWRGNVADNLPKTLTDDPLIIKALLDNSLDSITLIDRQGLIAYQSPSCEDLTGFMPSELLNTPMVDFIHPDDIDVVTSRLADVLSGPSATEILRIKVKSKQELWVDIEVVTRHFSTDGFVGAICNSRGTTEKLRMLSELRSTYQVLLKMFESSQIMLSISNLATGKFTHVNPAWVQGLGFSSEQALGSTADTLGIWGSEENRDNVIRSLTSKGFLRDHEATLYRRGGKALSTIFNAEILEVDGDRHILFSARDMTENIKIQNQLRQSMKMEALGQMTGGVAHDFNNLLNVVQSGTELLADLIPEQPGASDIQNSVQRAIDRGVALTHQLLAFSRRQHLQPQSIDISQRVDTMMPLLATTMGDNIEIALTKNPALWSCEVDPTQLETAVINLALNARDAMPQGGQLQIELGNVLDETTPNSPMHGDYVFISLTDNGAGMTPIHVDQAFEPFFTTKDIGKGTGLGLTMVFGFIRQSGGHVDLHSEKGTGTTVTLMLPRSTKVSATNQSRSQTSLPRGNGEHILLLEDDHDLRALTQRILKNLKYEVFEASNEAEVTSLLAQDIHFDLMVSDVLLPGPLKGPQIAQKVLQQQPHLKIMFISGYVEGSSEIEIPDVMASSFLAKPFSQKALAEAVATLLSQGTV
jgi:PAS domain S-box-containing protein